jgi:hypothetical protein
MALTVSLSVRKSWNDRWESFTPLNVGAIRFVIVIVVENRVIPDFSDGLERAKHQHVALPLRVQLSSAIIAGELKTSSERGRASKHKNHP